MSIVSAYVPQVEFRSPAWRTLRQEWLDPKIEVFFSDLGVDHYFEVEQSKAIVDREYRYESKGGVPFQYFYEVLLQNIKKEKNGEVVGVGYTLTYDDALVGLDPESDKEANQHAKTGLHYSPVLLGGKPVFYYLHLDLQKVLKRIRRMDLSSEYPPEDG
jgi:hypothetical protein